MNRGDGQSDNFSDEAVRAVSSRCCHAEAYGVVWRRHLVGGDEVGEEEIKGNESVEKWVVREACVESERRGKRKKKNGRKGDGDEKGHHSPFPI